MRAKIMAIRANAELEMVKAQAKVEFADELLAEMEEVAEVNETAETAEETEEISDNELGNI